MKKHIKWIVPAAAGLLLIVLLIVLIKACGGEDKDQGAQTGSSTAVTTTLPSGSSGGTVSAFGTTTATPDDPVTPDAPDTTDTPVTTTGDAPSTTTGNSPVTTTGDTDETSGSMPESGVQSTDTPVTDTPVTDRPTTTTPTTNTSATNTSTTNGPVTEAPVTDDDPFETEEEPTEVLAPSQLYAKLLSAEDVTLTVRFTQDGKTETVVVRKSGDRVRLNVNLSSRTTESYVDFENSVEYTKKANGSWQKKAMSDPYTWEEALEGAFSGVEDYLAKDSNYGAYNASKGRYEMTSSARKALGKAFEMEYSSVYLACGNGIYTLHADESDPTDDDFKMVIECVFNFDPITVGLPKV